MLGITNTEIHSGPDVLDESRTVMTIIIILVFIEISLSFKLV